MGVEITTISVHPDAAEQLRDFRDENDLANLDSAVRELLNRAD